MDSRAVLAGCALFADMPATALDRLAELCRPRNLSGGEVLFRAGDPADQLHILASGRIRMQRDGRVVGDIGSNEPIGEISILSDEPRGVDAYALRDSQLLTLDGPELIAFLLAYPTALLAMTRVVVQRMRRNLRETLLESARREHSIAVVALMPGVDGEALADRLSAALQQCGARSERIGAETVDAALGPGTAQTPVGDTDAHQRLMDWLNERDSNANHLVYSAGPGDTAWSERCLRQCDRVLLALPASAVADAAIPLLVRLRQMRLRVPIDLVLLRPQGAPAGDVAGWRAVTGAAAHYFLRPDNIADFASLARQLSGHGLGLVLGGGGARGFAHLGLLRALEQSRLVVDLAGGTSMGAFFAALHALGLDSRSAQEVARATFVDHNYLNDYVLPRVSLLRGRKFLTQLHAIFGDLRIEDLRKPFFAVSTNLTRATTMVHDSGPLAIWVGTSMAVPGIVPPVAWRGDLLVDGAVTNSLPTDVMHALGRGPIIASDVSTEGGLQAPGISGPDPEAMLDRARNTTHVSLIDILFGGMSLTSESGVRMRAERADLYLRMPVADFHLFDWKRLNEAVDRGYAFAMEQLAKRGPDFLQRPGI